MTPRRIEMGLEDVATTNLVLISTRGEYAAAEAFKGLRLGLNVSLHHEIALKRYARDHDLMVMGPDCGTVIINGIPLASANVVRHAASVVNLRSNSASVSGYSSIQRNATCFGYWSQVDTPPWVNVR